MLEDRITLRPARAGDEPAMLALMDGVLDWLVAHGRSEQWGTVPFSEIPDFPENVGGWVKQGVITLAERNGRCVGLLAVAPLIPPRIPAGLLPAGTFFIQTVMSDRGPDGQGVGSALMDEAERLARQSQAPALALDHWAESAELDHVYAARGYIKVAEYDDTQDDKPKRNSVRVLHLAPENPSSDPKAPA